MVLAVAIAFELLDLPCLHHVQTVTQNRSRMKELFLSCHRAVLRLPDINSESLQGVLLDVSAEYSWLAVSGEHKVPNSRR